MTVTARILALLCLLLLPGLTPATRADGKVEPLLPPPQDTGRRMVFPHTTQYLTLAADLHTHSVFSDGHVWPSVRVAEALRDGLDALAVTEHMEWQPHIADLPHPDRNRAFEIARDAARDEPIMVLAGAEITRELPVGHINAIFLRDANALLRLDAGNYSAQALAAMVQELEDWGSDEGVDEYYIKAGMWPAAAAVAAANAQGAFLFWNHPSDAAQAPDGMPPATAQHTTWFERGQVQGIEVVNGNWYSPESFQLALDYELALIGTSDVHDLIDWDYQPDRGGHRPVTLVFAQSRSLEHLKEALFARRTAVWFKDSLLGRAGELEPLVLASLVVTAAQYRSGTSILRVALENRSSVPLVVENRSALGNQTSTGVLTVPALGSASLELAVPQREPALSWPVTIRNAYVAPGTALEMTLDLRVTGDDVSGY